jgi:hypothetical protein
MATRTGGREEAHMAIGMLAEIPGGTIEQYEAVVRALDVQHNPPAGGLFHSAGEAQGVLRVVEVWESQAELDAFVRDRLRAAIEQVGMPQPRMTVWPLHAVRAAPQLVPQG